MSTTDNDIPPETVPPGRRPTTRNTTSRAAGRGVPPDLTGPTNRSTAMAALAGTTDDQVPQDQVPPHGFTPVVSNSNRQRGYRPTINRVTTVPGGDSDSTTLPTNENRLLIAEDFFHEEDTIPEGDDAPTQPEDKFEALMRAITKRLDESDTRLGKQLDDITTKLKELDDIKSDTKNRFDELDDTIDAAIINKLDAVVKEVTERVQPIIDKQVTSQVTTAIDSHVTELRQKHTNMHNMTNSIRSYKQHIDGELSAIRDSNKTITDLIRDRLGDINDNTDSTHDGDTDDGSNTPNNNEDINDGSTTPNSNDTNNDNKNNTANNHEGVDSNNTNNNNSGIGSTNSTYPPTANNVTPNMDHTALAHMAQSSTQYAVSQQAWQSAPRASSDTSTTTSTLPPNNATTPIPPTPHSTPLRTPLTTNPCVTTPYNPHVPSTTNPCVTTPSNPHVTTPSTPSPTVDYITTSAAINCLIDPGPYHGGSMGYNLLSDTFLNNCGFSASLAHTSLSCTDLMHAYSNLRAIHTLVLSQWFNGHSSTSWSSGTSGTSGPQVYRLIGKQLSILPKLKDIETSTVIDFYDKLHDVTKHFLIPTVPFDAIIISQGYHALCIPGLGLDKFLASSKALLELLPHLIDSSMSNNINAAFVSVKSTTKCGYDFLWHILRLTVPGFNPATTAQVPLWQFNTDILEFAKDFLLYFRLQRLLRTPHTDSARSLMFLHAIKGSEYIESVNVMVTAVENTVYADPMKPLPDHLQLHSLAQRLSSNTRTRLTSALVPYANMTAYGTQIDASPYGAHSQQQYQLTPYTQQPSFEQVHHLSPPIEQVNRIGDRRVQFDSNRNSARPSSLLPTRHPSNRGGDLSPRTREIHPTQARTPSRRSPPNPTRSRRPYVDVQCPACHRRGHHVQNCDMLAMAISLNHYIREQLTPEMVTAIEANWLERHRPQLDNIQQTPRQVLRAYADAYNYTTADIENSLDWDTWDDTPEPFVNMTEATQDPVE